MKLVCMYRIVLEMECCWRTRHEPHRRELRDVSAKNHERKIKAADRSSFSRDADYAMHVSLIKICRQRCTLRKRADTIGRAEDQKRNGMKNRANEVEMVLSLLTRCAAIQRTIVIETIPVFHRRCCAQTFIPLLIKLFPYRIDVSFNSKVQNILSIID